MMHILMPEYWAAPDDYGDLIYFKDYLPVACNEFICTSYFEINFKLYIGPDYPTEFIKRLDGATLWRKKSRDTEEEEIGKIDSISIEVSYELDLINDKKSPVARYYNITLKGDIKSEDC